MKNVLYTIALATGLWSSNVFSQIEIGVQCDNCSSLSNIARQQAATYDLHTDDIVNVIDMKNVTLDSFSVNRIVNQRNGEFVYLVVSTSTSTDVQVAFNEANEKLYEVIQSLKAPGADIDITTVRNTCAGVGQYADSVWDLVACVPAVSKLTDRVEAGEFTSLGASLSAKLITLARTAGISIMGKSVSFQFDTSDGGKLVFDMTYTVITNDEVTIKAEFDFAASTDAEGNPLDASSLESGTASGGGVYFTGEGGSQAAEAAALQSFLKAAERLGLIVDPSNPSTGAMSCVMSSDGTKLVCHLI